VEKVTLTIFTLLVAVAPVSTVLECGVGQCDDDPLHYLLLECSARAPDRR
jgi:hypothetical protein